MIPAQFPGSPSGAAYEFVDERAVPGVAYWYGLDVVDIHSQATRHGPVSATASMRPVHTIYLPAVSW